MAAPPVVAAMPRHLGGFLFWRGERPFLDTVGPAYGAATPRALDLFIGQVSEEATAETAP